MIGLLLVACVAHVDFTDPDGHFRAAYGALDVDSWSETASSNGETIVPIEVASDTASFLVTVTSSARPVLETLVAPDGTVVLDAAEWAVSDETLVGAFDGDRRTAVLNWPVRGIDGPLAVGTWTAQFAGDPGTSVDLAIHRKTDDDLAAGVVTVRLAFADGLYSNDVREGIGTAVAGWQALWAPHGLEVVATEHETQLDPAMDFVANGDPSIQAFAEEFAGRGELVVVIGDVVTIKPSVFGTSAGTPGTVLPTDYNFVAIAWGNAAGFDGLLNGDEPDVLAVTLAHEVGHYMGVPHPVEIDWAHWDALEDTSDCNSESACESSLGDNVMFPTLSSDAPSELTPQQVEVLHRYVGAL